MVHATATPVEHLKSLFDVILANMDAATLIALAPAIGRCLAPEGWIGLSGLSPAQVPIVAAAYRPLKVVTNLFEDDWEAVIAVAGSQSGSPA